MSRSKPLALVRSLTLVASVGAPCLAHAADLLPPPPPPVPYPVEVGGGWYLRGDVGVGATEYDKIATKLTGEHPDLPSNYAIDQKTIDSQFFAGAGVGYQVNEFLRGDITGEYRGGGRISYVESFDNGGGTGIDLNSANLRAIVAMANVYFDLGTWSCLTPYIGGGVGAAFLETSGYTDIGAGTAASGFGVAKPNSTTNLAWNLQAGISYAVTPNFKVDVGYRYINMGNAKAGPVSCYNSDSCSQASYTIKDITSHDVKIGLRYLIGAAAAPLPPLMPPPGPIVTKY